MEPRLKYRELAPDGMAKMSALEHYLNAESGLEAVLMELVRLRVSLSNGCGSCIRLHTAELKKHNETPERIAGLAEWRGSARLHAAGAGGAGLAEAVTDIQQGHAPDVVYDEMRAHFAELEAVNLTLVVTMINAWNRIAIALGTRPDRG